MASDISLSFRFSPLQVFLPRLCAPGRARRALLWAPSVDGKLWQHALRSRRRKCGRQRFVAKSFLQDLLHDLSQTVTDEQLREEREVLDKNRSLGSIAEVIQVDDDSAVQDEEKGHKGALPSLQVQSLQEQEVLAATPAHSEGLYALYASFFAGNLVEQIWHFAWPSAVALLHESLLPVAVVSFVSKFVIFIGGPWVGAQMDSLPRVFAFNALSAIQTVAQVVSAGAIIYALDKAASSAPSTSCLLVQPWFITLVLTSAIERLTGLASGVAFERDWVILLAGANRPIALADANAMLCRVNLLCEMLGTSIFGILLSKYSPVTCLMLAAGVMAGSLPVLIFLVYCTNKLSKGVLDRPKVLNMHELKINQRSSREKSSANGEGDCFHMFKLGWAQYLAQPALPASLAAVFLFFNIGLAPGSLMTSFLTQRGLNPSIIGAFSGMGAFMGFSATFLSTALVRKFGVLMAGAIGLVLQASLLAVAVIVYWSNSLTHPNSVTFFLALIILSRLGHFTYDIVGGQILQTAVHPSQANIVGTTEISLASLAELLMLGVAIIANDVAHFGSLAALSMAAVIGAATVYYRWMSNISKKLTTPPFDFALKGSDSSWKPDSQDENICNCNI